MAQKRKIDIQPKLLDAEFDFEVPAENCPLVRLTQAIAHTMAQHPDFAQAFFDHPVDHFGSLDLPDRPLCVEVVLCKNTEDIGPLIDNSAPSDCVGVFAMSSGMFNPDCWKADAFRVIVPCDMRYLRDFILQERNNEVDPTSDRYDAEFLFAYLVTLTHELAHAREFILHGQGFTPEDIDSYFDESLIDVDCADVASGRLICEDMLDVDPEEASRLMEDRVEAQGRQWLRWAMDRVPQGLIEDVLDAVRRSPNPKERGAQYR